MNDIVTQIPAPLEIETRTWLKFLIGEKWSILRIAGSWGALWVGFLFVLSAGFAREYDGEDLLHEPWHVLIPVGASLALSAILFTPFWFRIDKPQRPTFASSYRSFLTLFWMTAPMAWLYAIPYERLLSAPGSIRANLWTLAFVSLWRVLLISRVLSVLTGRHLIAVLAVVLLIADIAMQVALRFVPLPIVQIMGGVRLTESEALLADIAFLAVIFGSAALVPLIPLAILSLSLSRSGWNVEAMPQFSRIARPLMWLSTASVGVWILILPLTQGEQQRRRIVERRLQAGRIDEAINFMSSHARNAFPPHWDPPPRFAYPMDEPPLIDVVEKLAARRADDDWVRQVYIDKFERDYLASRKLTSRSDSELNRVLAMLEKMPEGSRMRSQYFVIDNVEKYLREKQPDSTLPATQTSASRP